MNERKENFTPGPWDVYDTRERAEHAYDYYITAGQYFVAAVSPNSLDIQEANASLIAASPEMYENERVNVALLKACIKFYDDISRKAGELFCDAYLTSVVDILRERIWKTEQLLAKARGEAEE